MSDLWSLLQEFKIVIPPIQRDYAQGRETGKIPAIRERFIDSIYNVLSDDNLPRLELDFIYGYTEEDNQDNNQVKVFKPLDGQQRLTTLFLIHWFVSNKESRTEEAKHLLKKFTYSTRQTSRQFCEKLIDFDLDLDISTKVDEQIINQPWFYSNWKNDPTIQSMLVVLKDIQEAFVELHDTWEKLTGDNPRIVFHLLSMNDLGLPDDLYIKMNARGKPLTDFEHFKSSFSEMLNEDQAIYFNEKVDSEWSDLFWDIFKERESEDIAKLVDAGFLSFFWYITDMLIKQQEISVSNYWLKIIETVYQGKDENIQFLFDSFDLFLNFSRQKEFPFDFIFYTNDADFVITKTKLFFKNAKPNLFHKCVETYIQGNFVIREQLLLYAFIRINLSKIRVPQNFYRLTRNLLENATDKQIRNENLRKLYLAIDDLISGERQPENLPFTHRQLAEEDTKETLLSTNPELREIIYKLEDHTLLRGTVGVFSLDNNIGDLGDVFLNIFQPECNYFEISRSILTFGLYPQDYGRGYLRFGNKNNTNWREILTQSENRSGFDITKNIFQNYLNYKKNQPGVNNLTIADNHLGLSTTPKDLLYYYIKYKSFILWGEHQTDGYYWWENFAEKPYECIMLFRTNFRGRSWNPFLLEISKKVNKCSMENYNSTLQFTNENLILILSHNNEGFRFTCPPEDNYSTDYINHLIVNKRLNQSGCLLIEQDLEGVDTVDRIEKCIGFLNSLTE